MTAAQVEFHTGVADPVGFACRLLRKASRSGARVLVTAPPERLAALDRELWTFDPGSFVAHVRISQARPGMLGRTPIWLADDAPPQADRPRLLVNVGDEAPAHAGAFDRVIEIVADNPDAVAAGRDRWRHYEQWGAKPLHHPRGGGDSA